MQFAFCINAGNRFSTGMKVDGKAESVAEVSGKYSPELATVYAKEARRTCKKTERASAVKQTEL